MKEWTGMERRKILLTMMQQSQTPISGNSLGKKTGVSRQVVVQDIALLRTEGYPIRSTPKGYYLEDVHQRQHVRTFKVYHTNDEVEDELNAIVDLGIAYQMPQGCAYVRGEYKVRQIHAAFERDIGISFSHCQRRQ